MNQLGKAVALCGVVLSSAASAQSMFSFCKGEKLEEAGPLGAAICATYNQDALNYRHFDAPQRQAEKSHVERVGFLYNCFNSGTYMGELGWSNWPLCGIDAQKVEKAAFDAELKAATLPPAVRKEVEEKALKAFKWRDEFVPRIQARAAKDPEFKAAVVDTAQKAYDAWFEAHERHQRQFEVAAAFEEEAERTLQPPADCGEKLHGAIQEYLDARKPKNREEAETLLADDVGYVLTRNLQICHKMNKFHAASRELNDLLHRFGVRRGPRTAAVQAVALEVARLQAKNAKFGEDDGKAKEMTRRMGAHYEINFRQESGSGEEGWAPIAAIKVGKDGRGNVSFKKQKAVQMLGEWVKTDKVKGFSDSGQPIFHEYWKHTGTAKITITQFPLNFPKYQLGNLSKGMTISYRFDGEDATIVTAFKDKKETKLVNLYGFSL